MSDSGSDEVYFLEKIIDVPQPYEHFIVYRCMCTHINHILNE